MMLQELALWPNKLQEGFNRGYSFYKDFGMRLPKKIHKIAFVGMGGSGISGRILKTFLDRKSGISTIIIDSSQLPACVDTETLAIVMSYSGNTWETLAVLDQLVERAIPTIVLAHGGKAIEIAGAKNLPFMIMPYSLSPRSALGSYLGFLLGLFDQANILEGKRKLEIFKKHAETYSLKFSDINFFKDFLERADGHDNFHIWGVSQESAAFAYRAQTQFNENSKVQAVFSAFPELCHNLLVGLSNWKTSPLVLVFHTDFLPANVLKAIVVTDELLKENRVVLYKPPILGDTFEAQLFNIILWSDFASYYLGAARGVDVTSVKIIDTLKEKQKQKGIN